jgi:hypothetical protein
MNRYLYQGALEELEEAQREKYEMDALVAQYGGISAVEPSLRDQATGYLADGLQAAGLYDNNPRAAARTAGALTGVMDFLPGTGEALAVADAENEFAQGNVGMGVLYAAGALPLVPPAATKAAGKAVRAVKGALERGDEAAEIKFDRDMDLMQRVKDPDSVNEMQLEVAPGPALLDDPIVSAEDLEGRGFVSGMSDTSRGDRSVITSANGVEMQTDRWGGQDYSRQPENAARGALWAADQGAITGFANAANATMDLPGVTRSPIWMPYGMMGASTDYAHMTTDFMYPMAVENMSKRSQKALDKRVREGAGSKTDYFRPQPDFPGMGKVETEAWLREAGHRRKSLAKAIDEFRDDAGVNLSMARGALVDPGQLDPRLGNLRTVGVLNMDDMVAKGPHPSYPVDINGQYLGRFGPGANLLDDFSPMRRPAGDRKVADDFKTVMESRGHDLSAKKMPAAVGKAMAQGLIGTFDQETLDWLIKQGYIKS